MRVKPAFLAHKNGLIEGNLTDLSGHNQVTKRLQVAFKGGNLEQNVTHKSQIQRVKIVYFALLLKF